MKTLRTSLALAIALIVSSPASAGQAFWTGQMEQVTTITGLIAWRCEYNFAGQTFWRVYQYSCPSSVAVH